MRSLDFDDVCLVPRVISEIESRDDIKIKVSFGKFDLTCPVIASPMKDVCDGNVAKEMNRLGGLGIIHRFLSIEDQVAEYNKCLDSACAIGINGDYFERFLGLYEAGCRLFCLDVANAGSIGVKQAAEKLESYKVDLIVGNVASKEVYQWCDSLPNVKAIRVGIAGGNACTTKNATGIGYGMFSTILECVSVKNNALLIADGGIKEPQDMCKSIIAGADLIMLGSAICSTVDSPAEILIREDKQYKIYHGSASFDIQKEYKEKPKYIEGKTRLLEYKGETLEQLLSRYGDGLRSSMSYFNARSLEEYRKNISWSEK